MPDLPDGWTVADLDRLTIATAKRIVSDPASSPPDCFLALERLRELSAGDSRRGAASHLYEADLPGEDDREAIRRELREAGLAVLNVRDPGSWPEEVADVLFDGTDGGWSIESLPDGIREHVEALVERRANEVVRSRNRRDGEVVRLADERRASIGVAAGEQACGAMESAKATEHPGAPSGPRAGSWVPLSDEFIPPSRGHRGDSHRD